MALQMPVYLELSSIEAKVFMGMSWRQLAAAILLAVGCGDGYLALILFAGVDANLAMYVAFVPGVPIAAWGWVRPKGLKPERYMAYVVRHYTERGVWLLDGPARRVRLKSGPSLRERTGRRGQDEA